MNFEQSMGKNHVETKSLHKNIENEEETSKTEDGFEVDTKDGETEFELLGRLSEFLIHKQEEKINSQESDSRIRLRKKSSQIKEVYREPDNQELIKRVILKSTEMIGHEEELSEANGEVFDNIKVSSSSRNMSWDIDDDSQHSDKINYFSKTNQNRSFFPSDYKKDGVYYSGSLFNVHSNSPEAKEYLKQKLENKSIYMFGGGKSASDLLQDNDIQLKQMINIDPFISAEEIDRNDKGVYRSLPMRADDTDLLREVNDQNLELADEIWASYSVPFYNKSKAEIDDLFANIKQLLKEGGNCRLVPLSTQNEEAKQAIISEIKNIIDSKEYNIHTHEDTLVIHKLKN